MARLGDTEAWEQLWSSGKKTMKVLEVEGGDKWLPGTASSRIAEHGKPLFLGFEEKLWWSFEKTPEMLAEV